MRTIRTLPRPSTLLTAAVMAMLAFAGYSQAASAATGFGRVASFGAGEFSEGPGAVAVNQSSGDVYVVDHGNQVVRRYDSEGKTLGSWAVSSPAGVAVDDSKGESVGDVYVLSNAEGEIAVKKFDGEGKAMGEVKETEAGTPFGGLSGVAVDKEGGLWVQQSSGEVDRFDGKEPNVFQAIAFTAPEAPCTGAFAIDENEHLYLPIGCASEQFNMAGEDLGQLDANFVAGVTAELETNRVFANDGYQVSQYNEKREPLATFGSGVLSGCGAGIAVNHATQHVYVADPCNSQVYVFAPVTLPSVTINPPTGITSTHADFSGTVSPEGTEPANETTWHFEYSTDKGESWAQTAGGTLEPGASPVTVKDEVSLLPNQHVQVRLAATDAAGTVTSKVEPEDEFDTPAIASVISEQSAQDITPTHVTLKGLVNPEHSATVFWFEYGTSTAYGASVPAGQNGEAGAGTTPFEAIEPVYGLTPAATYHYRLTTKNVAGTVHGEDQTFKTPTAPGASSGCPNEAFREAQNASFLPDCRAYERVSPSDKNGGDVMADSGRTHVAIDGSAVQFSSLAAFGDAIGTSVATDYMSLRDPTTGWATHAITPRQDSTTYLPILLGLQSLYSGFSSDLSKGVFVGWSPVTNDSNVAKVANMYLRENSRTPGAGSYELVSACPLCAATSTPLPPLPADSENGVMPRFEGASSDYGHVLFGSQQPLTTDAPSGCTNLEDVNQCPANLYEWDHGTLRLAGILPDGSSAHGSQAGQDAAANRGSTALTPHVISADGSRIFFTVPDAPRSHSGALYMRVNHTTTVQLNASERTPPLGPQPATYWDASSDGSRVFFTSQEALTDNAVSGTLSLYMYDASKPDSDPHNLTLISTDNEPSDTGLFINVQGVSSDGHYVYFAAAGQLVAGQPLLGIDRGLYVWHDGTIRFITTMHEFADNSEDTTTTSWSFFQPTSRVTPDGLHMLFSSSRPGAGPTGYDQGHCADAVDSGCREFYLYSYDSQRLACVSCNPSGAPMVASAFTAQRLNTSASLTSPAENHPLTDDGKHVFFATKEALVPQDVNGKIDVYEYDASSGTVRLITNGIELSDSYFMDASPSGNDALLLTRARLVGADTDNSYDLYDARIGGGFSEPLPPPPPCSGDSCQGAQLPAPQAPNIAWSLFTGTGNLTPAAPAAPGGKPRPKQLHCRKGYLRRKVKGRTRCVRKPGKRLHRSRGQRTQSGALQQPRSGMPGVLEDRDGRTEHAAAVAAAEGRGVSRRAG